MLGDEADLTLDRMSGMSFNPLTGQWRLGTDTGINYIASFRRGEAEQRQAPPSLGTAPPEPLPAEPAAKPAAT